MAADVIKEFLVSLGYRIDSGTERKFTDSLKNTAAEAGKLALALEAMAVAAAAAVAKVAQGLDTLYFASQRTGASAENIRSLGYAFGQLGSSSAQAQGALDSFAQSLRANPALLGVLRSYGVTAKDAAQQLAQLGARFSKESDWRAIQEGALFGLGPDQVRVLQQLGRSGKGLSEGADVAKRLGLNTKEATENANKLWTQLRELEFTIQGLALKVTGDLAPAFAEWVKAANDWATNHASQIRDFLASIAAAVVDMSAAFIRLLGDMKPVWDYFSKVNDQLTQNGGFLGTLEKIEHALSRIAQAFRDFSNGDVARGFKNLFGGLHDLDSGTSVLPGGGLPGSPGGSAGDPRTLWQRTMPKWLGGKDAPGGGAPGSTGEGAANPSAAKALGDAIAGTESGKAGYDAVLGNGKYGSPDKPLTQMTLAEVREFGKKVRAAHGSSSALGRYQIVNSTRADAQAALGLPDDTVYSPAVQDRMMRWIARNQGLGAWEGLKSNPAAMAAALRALQEGGALDAPPARPGVLTPPTGGNNVRARTQNPGAASDTRLASLMRGEPISSWTGAATLTPPVNTNNSTHAPITQTTSIHVDARGDSAHDIAGSVGRLQEGINTRLQRNVQSVVQQ